jgi:hypothetical protein
MHLQVPLHKLGHHHIFHQNAVKHPPQFHLAEWLSNLTMPELIQTTDLETRHKKPLGLIAAFFPDNYFIR